MSFLILAGILGGGVWYPFGTDGARGLISAVTGARVKDKDNFICKWRVDVGFGMSCTLEFLADGTLIMGAFLGLPGGVSVRWPGTNRGPGERPNPSCCSQLQA